MGITVASLYQFATVPDPHALRDAAQALGQRLALKGTLIVAAEGINGTLAGADAEIATFLAALRGGIGGAPAFDGLELKCAGAAQIPFRRLKIRVKREIVTIAAPQADPRRAVGIYVDPANWNALLDDPEITLVDARNAFEVAHGSFPGAIDPQTETFSAFPAFAERQLDPATHRKVAMFCTGGIRCEKATSLLKARGFAEVYHLKGGILAYLAKVAPAESRWQGHCFVFDERKTIGHATSGEPGDAAEEKDR